MICSAHEEEGATDLAGYGGGWRIYRGQMIRRKEDSKIY